MKYDDIDVPRNKTFRDKNFMHNFIYRVFYRVCISTENIKRYIELSLIADNGRQTIGVRPALSRGFENRADSENSTWRRSEKADESSVTPLRSRAKNY